MTCLTKIKAVAVQQVVVVKMGLIKRELHPETLNDLADEFRALSHPARLAILNRIAADNACICGDLSKELGLAQATVSQHLKVLKDAGLIKGSIEGTSMCYCIDREKLAELRRRMDFLFESLTPGDEIPMNDCCD